MSRLLRLGLFRLFCLASLFRLFQPSRSIRTRLEATLHPLLALLALSLSGWGSAWAAGAVVTTDQVRAELLVHAPGGLQPGQPAWLGLKLQHKPGWHTYWINPGDSGLPTSLQWQLPAFLQAGEIEWPVPHKLPIGPLMNHGYEGTLLLPVPLTVTAAPGVGPLTLKLRADWLVCKDVCIPEGGDFTLTLPAGSAQSALVGGAALFEQVRARIPVALPGTQAAARTTPEALQLVVQGLPAAWAGKVLTAFPEAPQLLSPSAEARTQWLPAPGGATASGGGTWEAALPYSPQRMEAAGEIAFVISPADNHGAAATPAGPVAVRVVATVAGPWPPLEGAAPVTPPATAIPASTTAPAGLGALLLSMGLALVGGLILNLMPCVFPVLSLKVFGFAQHAHDRRGLAVGGLAYTAGVVLSFAALAGLLLALRASGEQLGWGFQLQSPLFVSALAILFTLMGLNLLGLFEITLLVPGGMAGAQARHPVLDHFLTGVLAVLVASPCTAPFMGASLGVAVTLPAAQALLVFVSLGLGMALPYLGLSLLPSLAAKLPRPGVWMVQVRQAMALPMLATVVWLLWVLGHQVGVDGATALLAVMLMLGFAIGAWNMGREGSAWRPVVRALATAAWLGTAWMAWPLLEGEAEAGAGPAGASVGAVGAVGTADLGAAGAGAGAAGAGAAAWQPWSAVVLAEHLAQGRTVFVDYTAAWCVTCQVNKRSTLRRDDVMQALQAKGIVTLQADWTRRDEGITRELSRLGRNGVPVYAFYSPGAQPVLLPEVLTPAVMRDAISALKAP